MWPSKITPDIANMSWEKIAPDWESLISGKRCFKFHLETLEAHIFSFSSVLTQQSQGASFPPCLNMVLLWSRPCIRISVPSGKRTRRELRRSSNRAIISRWKEGRTWESVLEKLSSFCQEAGLPSVICHAITGWWAAGMPWRGSLYGLTFFSSRWTNNCTDFIF